MSKIEKFLPVNIRQFEEQEPVNETPEEDFSKYIKGDSLDVEGLIRDFAEDTSPSNAPKIEDEQEPNVEEPEQPEEPENPNDETSEPEEVTENQEPTEQKPQKRTPDQAFAEMRRRVEQYEPLAKWVEELAKRQGFQSPQQLIDEFNKQQLAKEAQEKGVPVDIYERLQRLEQENKQKDEMMFQERFNAEVEATRQKHKLTDEQITETLQFMAQRGYVDENGRPFISFEDAYMLANKDTLIKQAEERAKQELLEEKQRKQQQANPDVGTHASDKQGTSDLDYSSEGIFKTLEKYGIEWR